MEKLLTGQEFTKEAMKILREFYIYNVGTSGKAGAEYIIRQLLDREK